MSDGWDPSIVDFAAPIDGYLTRSFGGRAGPTALENGARLTFPFTDQLQIAGSSPGTVYGQPASTVGAALILESPVIAAGDGPATIELRGADTGKTEVWMQSGGAPGAYTSLVLSDDNASLLGSDGSQITLTDTTLNIVGITEINTLSNTSTSIQAVTSITIATDPTTGTDITIQSNAAMILNADTDIDLNTTSGDVYINGVDVSTPLGAWPTWTPTLTQSATVTKTVNNAAYQKDGRTVKGHTHLAVTGTGTAGNAVTVGLPVTSASFSGTPVIGTFWCYSSAGAVAYQGALIQVSTTTAVGWAHGLSGNIGAAPNFGLVNTDQVGYSFCYQAAS